MSNENTFSCYLIGSDSLLSECGGLLLDRGHSIRGVITDAPKLVQWAQEKSLPVIPASSDYGAVLRAADFDYLFSITHLRMIPQDVLATPNRAAINFHDGPLPRYAGLNAPAWALIQQEESYGITWHEMTAGADRGDILEQRTFPVSQNETSLSLNTQCFMSALEGFEALIPSLEGGELNRVAQNPEERTYFGRHDRPAAFGQLCWDREAGQLDALVRALHFGPYRNELGVARIAAQGQAFNVLRSAVEDSEEGAAPGTILDCSETGLLVATGLGGLRISSLTSVSGEPISPDEALLQMGLAVGETLPGLSAEREESMASLVAEVSRAEGFWRQRLETFEPIELPYVGTSRPGGTVRFQEVDLTPLGDAMTRNRLVAVLGVWLSRIGGKSSFSLPLRGWRKSGDPFPGVSSPVALASMDLDLSVDFDRCAMELEAQLEALAERAPWLQDLIAREPTLYNQPRLRKGELSSVEVVVASNPGSVELAPGVALALVVGPEGRSCALVADEACVDEVDLVCMKDQLTHFVCSLSSDPSRALARHDLLGSELRRQVLEDWNSTERAQEAVSSIHELFARRVRTDPDRPALAFEDQALSYAELDGRASALARRLVSGGVEAGDLVGVYVERSLELVVAVLATLKSGAAYVPLDPDYPEERIALMIEDSGLKTVLATTSQVHTLPAVSDVEVIRVDVDRNEDESSFSVSVEPSDLSYVIYTSGSTGRPKGVMIEHANVINFFDGMDQVVDPSPEGVWFAVTSLSFDISVLELLWSLTRGLKVILFRDRARQVHEQDGLSDSSARHVDFGLYYWGNDSGVGRQKYKLLIEGARFADENGFNAVWTPERHFHSFGGPYPNPSVTGSAVAAVTKNIQIRAGSCVAPLHHPVRIAEEWAVVDNLSNRRVGLALASGWQPDDFILSSRARSENKAHLIENMEKLRQLWRGESVGFVGADGHEVEVVSQPRPVQSELPLWLTTAGNPETYREAARQGANVLTHLLGQSLEEVAEKITIYRETLRQEGRDPDQFKVTLMLHTFVGEDVDAVREIVREPMKDYLGGSVSLVKNFAWAFPAFKRPEGLESTADDIDLSSLSEDEVNAILEYAFERYFETSGLFGTVDRCVQMIEKCKEAGVDEIACLVDYGVPTDQVLDSLPLLKSVMVQSQQNSAICSAVKAQSANYSVAAQVEAHGVTHLQCTPSMARMLMSDEPSRKALGSLQHMLVGGEAFPAPLADELSASVGGRLTNMYGPTETTIWSSTHEVAPGVAAVPIGKPIANTQLYVLDERLEPVPPGVPGELYIGGQGVVRGYLHRPDLSAERFVPDPFVSDPEARMYRTGDLVSWGHAGVMDFIGRTDHQVKIRGYRIELGEIETRLGELDGVEEAVVLVREDTPDDKRIVGYVVGTGSVEQGEVRESLREHLPEYMVPQHIVQLDVLPLTPNGKIDRNALPAPDSVGASSASVVYVAPENELETRIVGVWQQVLGLERVGTQDNFFDLGGHSLLVVKAHRELKGLSDVPIALTDLYRFPTIHSLVEHLTSDDSGARIEESRDRGARRRDALQQRRRRRGPRG